MPVSCDNAWLWLCTLNLKNEDSFITIWLVGNEVFVTVLGVSWSYLFPHMLGMTAIFFSYV